MKDTIVVRKYTTVRDVSKKELILIPAQPVTWLKYLQPLMLLSTFF
jgi:hypothetical protein